MKYLSGLGNTLMVYDIYCPEHKTQQHQQQHQLQQFQKGVNYEIQGVACRGSGDPHFTMFNGATHHFMKISNLFQCPGKY